MSLLIISPDFASHYGPLAVLGHAARDAGHRVVIATGREMRRRVVDDGMEWRELALGATSNGGISGHDPSIRRFIDATRHGALATIRRQALDRQHDLLWQPERIAGQIARLCDELEPDRVLIDHVSFGSTLGMYATGRPFATLVPGHPSQLPVDDERYGVPTTWPSRFRPDPDELEELEQLVDEVTRAFTERWNTALAAVAPGRPAVPDAFRVHGDRVLYNTIAELQPSARRELLPTDHHHVGPLVRDEELPARLGSWARTDADRRGTPQVFVALGTFLSHRNDVLALVAAALGRIGARAAIASGATPPEMLGRLPGDWIVAPRLPQVAMLRHADVIVHHGGNNSVQESLAAGVRQVVLPFSTDQFSSASDLERIGWARVLPPNDATDAELGQAVEAAMSSDRPHAVAPLDPLHLVDALFEMRRSSLPASIHAKD